VGDTHRDPQHRASIGPLGHHGPALAPVAVPTRIAIAHRCVLFRDGLHRALEVHPEFEVVGGGDETDEVLRRLDGTPCDVLILDLVAPHADGLSHVAALAQRLALIVITADEQLSAAFAALRAGALGAVPRNSPAAAFVDAVRAVARGDAWIPPGMQAQILGRLRGAPVELTLREREIIALVARGFRNAEVARALFVTEATVKTHLNNVFNKLEIRDRVALTLYALRMGIINADSAGFAPLAKTPVRDRDCA